MAWWDDTSDDDQAADDSTSGGGGYDPWLLNNLPTGNYGYNDPALGGSYWSDVNGGWTYSPRDPDPGGNTGSADPTFYGGVIANQGDVPYDPSPIGTTLDTPDLGGGVYDTGSTFYAGNTRGQDAPYALSPIGNTLDTPDSSDTSDQTSDPTATGSTDKQKSSTPPAGKPTTQPPQSSMSVGLGGVPGITGALPQDQKFTYQPVAIARQGAPNANSPGPYDYQGQSALGKLAGAFGVPTSAQQIPQSLGIPTSLTQLRQQLGLTKAANPFGQSQNPYDSGL